MTAFAALVVEAKHAHPADNIRQSVFKFVSARRNWLRYAPDDDLGEGIGSYKHPTADLKYCIHVG